jgi:hypothetical protein
MRSSRKALEQQPHGLGLLADDILLFAVEMARRRDPDEKSALRLL